MAGSVSQESGQRSGPRGPYAKTERVREVILEACIESFSIGGFHGATMKDIAQRAGISQTGLMHHFPDKADLLIHVLQLRDRQMSAVISNAPSPDFVHRQLDVVRDNEARPGMVQLHTTISAEATDASHPAHELYRERYDNLRTYLEGYFQAQAEGGRLNPVGSPRAVANLFVAALDGLQLQWLYHPEDVDVAEALEALIDAFVPSTST